MIDIDKFKEYWKSRIIQRNEDTLRLFNSDLDYFRKFTVITQIEDINKQPTFIELISYIKHEKITSPTGRYLIFTTVCKANRYDYYYPSGGGGMEDLLMRTDDIENFKNVLRCLDVSDNIPELFNYFDLNTNETIDLKEEMKNDRTS